MRDLQGGWYVSSDNEQTEANRWSKRVKDENFRIRKKRYSFGGGTCTPARVFQDKGRVKRGKNSVGILRKQVRGREGRQRI